jgi:alkanesulfonate monooxygenase
MLRHKFEVLRNHCDAVGRDYATIERSNLSSISITPDGRSASMTPSQFVDRLGGFAEAGAQHTIVSIKGVWDIAKLELIGKEVIPQIAALGDPSPIG